MCGFWQNTVSWDRSVRLHLFIWRLFTSFYTTKQDLCIVFVHWFYTVTFVIGHGVTHLKSVGFWQYSLLYTRNLGDSFHYVYTGVRFFDLLVYTRCPLTWFKYLVFYSLVYCIWFTLGVHWCKSWFARMPSHFIHLFSVWYRYLQYLFSRRLRDKYTMFSVVDVICISVLYISFCRF